MYRDPTMRVLVATAVVVLVVAGSRWLREADFVHHRVYWMNKFLQPPEYDVAVGGDSRIYRGVSPAAMEKVFGERRVVNFGFSACGYENDYLDALQGLLRPGAARPTIVVGVTPLSLTPRAVRDNEFLRLRRTDRDQLVEDMAFARLTGPFRSFIRVGRAMELEREKGHFREKYYADGWVATLQPIRPDRALKEYVDIFGENSVAPEIVAELCAGVRRWRAASIRVYGFRPPASPALSTLEDREGGFDEPGFVREFAQAGGLWIPIRAADYVTYDGSHLLEDSAVRLSCDLAEWIRRSEAGGGTGD